MSPRGIESPSGEIKEQIRNESPDCVALNTRKRERKGGGGGWAGERPGEERGRRVAALWLGVHTFNFLSSSPYICKVFSCHTGDGAKARGPCLRHLIPKLS